MSKVLEALLRGATSRKKLWIFFALLAILAFAIAVLPAILTRRKLAKMAHERDVLIEEKKQAEVTAKVAMSEEAEEAAKAKAEAIGKRIKSKETHIKVAKKKQESFAKSLDAVTTWEELGV